MIVLDTELTGVDARKNAILSIGAVELENPENQFYGECRAWEGAHIEDAALAVNGFTRTQATDPNKSSDEALFRSFLTWAMACKEYTVAGQNVSLDLEFLKAVANRYHINWPFAYRHIDIHSIAYFSMVKQGRVPPAVHGHTNLNLDKILNFVGIPDEPKPHNALMGAKVEAEALSRLFYGKSLLEEFKNYPIPSEISK